MPTKKDNFGKWIYGVSYVLGLPFDEQWTYSNKYAMSLFEEIFDALGQAKVFNTLDLWSNYYQLPLKEGDKVKTFWVIDHNWKDCLY
jgi:hypothetical protein